MGPLLEVRGISKNYGAVRALSNVSFDLERGQILGLVGDNGAGRTTLLRILCGSLQPSGGEIFLNGEQTRFKNPAEAMRKGVAIVYQPLELVDIASVWENFFIGREITKGARLLDIRKMKFLTAESIAKYGHTFDTEREVGELSGGQKQIVAVTRAIQASPQILLLDEPTHGLSKRVIKDFFDLLRKTAKAAEGDLSIIITGQWYEQVSDFIDDVIILRMGEVVGHFTKKSADKAKIFKLAMGLSN
jgi:ABC-type sugar transport system ATPase subunit